MQERFHTHTHTHSLHAPTVAMHHVKFNIVFTLLSQSGSTVGREATALAVNQ